MTTSTKLAEWIAIAVPLDRAPHYLDRFLNDRRDAGERDATLKLTGEGPSRGHTIVATLVQADVGGWNGWNDSAEVSWHAEGGGPYPIFLGELKLLPNEPESTWLSVDGGYIRGGDADARAARRDHAMVQGTARQLLSQLKTAVERYHGDAGVAPSPARDENTNPDTGEMH